MIELHELAADEDCQNAQVHARVSESSKARYTKQFAVREYGSEVAFLALDLIPDVDYLVLYEIFVPSELRRRGLVRDCSAKWRNSPGASDTKRSL